MGALNHDAYRLVERLKSCVDGWFQRDQLTGLAVLELNSVGTFTVWNDHRVH